MRDGSGVVRDIQDGLWKLWKLESWKQWSGHSGRSSGEEDEEILQWTEVLHEGEWGECVVEGGGAFAPREFEGWAKKIKDRIDAFL